MPWTLSVRVPDTRSPQPLHQFGHLLGLNLQAFLAGCRLPFWLGEGGGEGACASRTSSVDFLIGEGPRLGGNHPGWVQVIHDIFPNDGQTPRVSHGTIREKPQNLQTFIGSHASV